MWKRRTFAQLPRCHCSSSHSVCLHKVSHRSASSSASKATIRWYFTDGKAQLGARSSSMAGMALNIVSRVLHTATSSKRIPTNMHRNSVPCNEHVQRHSAGSRSANLDDLRRQALRLRHGAWT